jgi:hypothetical protein
MPEAGENVIDSAKETVNFNNVKNVGEMQALTAAIACQNMVSHQNSMNQIRELWFTRIARTFCEMDPTEAASITPLIQQALKGAQSSQPETGAKP